MRKTTLLGALAAVLFLAGCGSMGGLGDILGGGAGTGSPTSSYGEVRGTVDSVDPGSNSLVLRNASTDGGYGTQNVRIYYDDRTPVEYQGRTYSPDDLERGDEIAARVEQSGNRLIADSMTVLRNVSGSGSTSGGYGSLLRGTVRGIDTSRRIIEVDTGSYNQSVMVEYDSGTDVNYNGRTYRPQDLERGDQIEIDGRQLSGNRLYAERIDVVRSMSDSGGIGSTTGQTLRGTVRNVDGNRRTIELDQISSRFINDNRNSVILYYDNNTGVEYQGRVHPPTNLERGDIIDVQVRQQGNTLLADRIYLVRDVNSF